MKVDMTGIQIEPVKISWPQIVVFVFLLGGAWAMLLRHEAVLSDYEMDATRIDLLEATRDRDFQMLTDIAQSVDKAVNEMRESNDIAKAAMAESKFNKELIVDMGGDIKQIKAKVGL